jgi:hypothetical protein
VAGERPAQTGIDLSHTTEARLAEEKRRNDVLKFIRAYLGYDLAEDDVRLWLNWFEGATSDPPYLPPSGGGDGSHVTTPSNPTPEQEERHMKWTNSGGYKAWDRAHKISELGGREADDLKQKIDEYRGKKKEEE